MKERVYAIDFIKFIAVIFITNSHFGELYKNINPALSTFGVHGNALFFFASGFTLTLSNSKENSFVNWYKKRINRIWPTFIVWAIIANLIWVKEITWDSMLLAKGYWFIQCILYSYIFLFYLFKKNRNILLSSFIASIMLTIMVVLLSHKTKLSIFHEFHWVCYISSMILGIYCGKTKPQIKKLGWFYTMLSFILYFFIMSFGKGKDTMIYYTQLIAIIPLNAFLYYIFAWSNSWMNSVSKKKYIYHPILWIGSLCLEIYVVQQIFITEKFNSLFPLNIIIVFTEIVLCAYFLQICTKFFIQTLSNTPYNWKSLFKI